MTTPNTSHTNAPEAMTAEQASIEHQDVDQITAERLTMNRSNAKQINTRSAQLDQSGVLQLQGERVVLQRSTAWIVATQEARLVKSRVLAVLADNAEIDGEAKTFLFVGSATGDVKTVVSPKGAIGIGAGLGLVLVLFNILVRKFMK